MNYGPLSLCGLARLNTVLKGDEFSPGPRVPALF